MMLPHQREFCEKVLRRAAQEYGMRIESVEVDEDHVHLYIENPPQKSFVRTVGEGVTAAMVRRYIKKHADKGLEPPRPKGRGGSLLKTNSFALAS